MTIRGLRTFSVPVTDHTSYTRLRTGHQDPQYNKWYYNHVHILPDRDVHLTPSPTDPVHPRRLSIDSQLTLVTLVDPQDSPPDLRSVQWSFSYRCILPHYSSQIRLSEGRLEGRRIELEGVGGQM